MDQMTSAPRRPRQRVLLQPVAHIEDADSDWLITLRCGHSIVRRKGEGRPTVFSRRHCPECLATSDV